MRLPTVFFAEGGGGRPGDTDYPVVSALDTRAFALWARLSGLVPRIAVVAGRCFAGNAVIAGCSDLIVATENISLGMGGPAMIEGGGLGDRRRRRGRAARDAGAATGSSTSRSPTRPRRPRSTKRLLGYFQGATPAGTRARPERRCASSSPSASAAPTRSRRSSRRSPTRARSPSCASASRPRWSPRWPGSRAARSGLIANDTRHMAGAITSDARRQGGALPAALRRLRPAGRLARRHAGDHGRARRPRRPGWSATPRACWSPARRCGCR